MEKARRLGVLRVGSSLLFGGVLMASTTATRPNHYEVLGLTPAASRDEIEQAFAREVSVMRPRAFGGVVDVTIAYGVLRDSGKRRAYDDSLGLKPPPPPAPALTTRGVCGAAFFGRTRLVAEPPERAATGARTPPEPEANPPARPELRTEPATTTFIAARLRELASPEPLIEPAPISRSEPPPRPDTDVRQIALHDSLGGTEADTIPWKRAAIAVGAMALAAAVLGAWTGWDSEAGKSAAKVALPPPTTFTVGDPAATAPVPAPDAARPSQPKQPPRAAARRAPVQPTGRPADLERELAESSAPAAVPVMTAEAPAAAAAAAARLPLSNAVIARTIARIGYPCGRVAATTAAEGGAPGAFTVTCTSGHSYRAAPVGGRYHFRRVGGR